MLQPGPQDLIVAESFLWNRNLACARSPLNIASKRTAQGLRVELQTPEKLDSASQEV